MRQDQPLNIWPIHSQLAQKRTSRESSASCALGFKVDHRLKGIKQKQENVNHHLWRKIWAHPYILMLATICFNLLCIASATSNNNLSNHKTSSIYKPITIMYRWWQYFNSICCDFGKTQHADRPKKKWITRNILTPQKNPKKKKKIKECQQRSLMRDYVEEAARQ